jgi:hypothetical protein
MFFNQSWENFITTNKGISKSKKNKNARKAAPKLGVERLKGLSVHSLFVAPMSPVPSI